MADWLTSFWSDVRGVIKAVLPEVGQIYRVRQIERLNWANEKDKGTLVTPYTVVQLPPMQQELGWGAANVVYKPTPTVFYILGEKDDVVVSSGLTVDAYLEAKMLAMQLYLESHSFSFTLLTPIIIDCTEYNPVNASMLMANMAFWCGSLQFTGITGYVAGYS